MILTLRRRKYRTIVGAVAAQATANPAFLRSLEQNDMPVPGDRWSSLMYQRLRTRWELITTGFDRYAAAPSNGFDVITAAERLNSLVEAINTATKDFYWQHMSSDTRHQYFGLLLDVIVGIVRRDYEQVSSAQRTHVRRRVTDVNLYQRMIAQADDADAARYLQGMATRGGVGGLEAVRIRAILGEILGVLNQHWPRGADNTPTNSPTPPVEWHTRIRQLLEGKSNLFCRYFLPDLNTDAVSSQYLYSRQPSW